MAEPILLDIKPLNLEMKRMTGKVLVHHRETNTMTWEEATVYRAELPKELELTNGQSITVSYTVPEPMIFTAEMELTEEGERFFDEIASMDDPLNSQFLDKE